MAENEQTPETAEATPDASASQDNNGVREAPTTLAGVLREIGPGLIVAGSIVGSGELIATTVTGAKAGFWLLWLIIIGCVIKVFVQVEIGRYSIVTGRTAMDGFVDVPGPRLKRRGNWLFWYWFLMFVVSIGQLGGIVGGVGQALSISYPITTYGKEFNELGELRTKLIVETKSLEKFVAMSSREAVAERADIFTATILVPLLEKQAEKVPGQKENAELVIRTLTSKPRLGLYLSSAYFQVLRMEEAEKALEKFKKGSAKYEKADEEYRRLRAEYQALAPIFGVNSQIVQTFKQIQQAQAELADPIDDEIWAGVITAFTIVVLVVGRFTLIQNFSTALVGMFTLVTVVNIFLLQSNPSWGFTLNDVLDGLRFQLPPDSDQGLTIALMAFGIIGVGANELVMYPYWCQEKGYGKFVGPNDGSEQWSKRAKGWMRVMRWDAWLSMVVYTFATVAFYLLGASILWRSGLTPSGNDTIRYLSVMYEPVFGQTAQAIFLIGAFAVLYSTFFVANAAHARTFSDALRVVGLSEKKNYRTLVTFFSVFFPLCCIVIYVLIPHPVKLVLLSGLMQALMLPMLAGAALYYRYYRIDKELQPGLIWDIFLWLSGVGMLVAGLWLGWTKIAG